MDFRWVAGIALWTFLSGPAIGPPAGAGTVRHSHKATTTQRKSAPPIKRVAIQNSAIARDYTKRQH
jgi:hypothetical protein